MFKSYTLENYRVLIVWFIRIRVINWKKKFQIDLFSLIWACKIIQRQSFLCQQLYNEIYCNIAQTCDSYVHQSVHYTIYWLFLTMCLFLFVVPVIARHESFYSYIIITFSLYRTTTSSKNGIECFLTLSIYRS